MDDAIKPYLASLDRAVVARGGTSIYAPRPQGREPIPRGEFLLWERERLDGYASRSLKTGKNHAFPAPWRL